MSEGSRSGLSLSWTRSPGGVGGPGQVPPSLSTQPIVADPDQVHKLGRIRSTQYTPGSKFPYCTTLGSVSTFFIKFGS